MDNSKAFERFMQACQAVKARADLRTLAGLHLPPLVGHDMFSCTLVRMADLHVHDALNLGFPAPYFDAVNAPQQHSRCPAARAWVGSRRALSHPRGAAAQHLAWDHAWEGLAAQHRVDHLTVHGVADIDHKNACLFTFARTAPWSAADHATMERIAPHLHDALSRAMDFGNKRPAGPLTQREQQVLQWVCSGKSNTEIASILEISAWTVKIHISHLLEKLNASNRSHAVAKAISFNLVSI